MRPCEAPPPPSSLPPANHRPHRPPPLQASGISCPAAPSLMLLATMAELSLPDGISEPLLKISGSSSLEDALQILIQTSRTDDGRSNLASKSVLPVALQLVHSLSCSHTRTHLLFPLRLLRNLCAGEARNQDMFIDHNGVEIVSKAIHLFGSDFDDSDCVIVRTGLQTMANASLAGERHQQAIWKHLFPVEFVEIARIRRRETSDPLAMIIYVCCDGSHGLFSELCKEPGLTIVAELISTASTVGFGEDWIKLLLSRVCLEESHLPGLFDVMRPCGSSENSVDGECADASFTSEQAFLLQIVSEILNERLREISAENILVLYILDIFKKAAAAVDFSSRCQSSLPTNSAAIDVLGYSLVILRDICAQNGLMGYNADGSSEDVVCLLLSEGLLDLLLRLLQELEPPSQIRKMMKQEENQNTASLSLKKVCPYKGFRRDIVSVIGNCAYRRKLVQDEVRNKNGILLLLQQCVLDDDNPFLREWGIWTARNLLENNEENRQLVADLEYQGSVDLPELSQAGLRVEVDPQTRHPKLVNIA